MPHLAMAPKWFAELSNKETPMTLRWFTPTNEVDLCGHATLATARVIFGAKDSSAHAQSITFDTISKGNLSAKLDPSTGQISLDFPSAPPGDISSAPPGDISSAPPGDISSAPPGDISSAPPGEISSAPPGDICDESFPNLEELLCACLGESNRDKVDGVFHSKDTRKLLVKLRACDTPGSADLRTFDTLGSAGSEAELRSISPDFARLLRVQDINNQVRGVIVTVASSSGKVTLDEVSKVTSEVSRPEIDFYSRYFAPWNGINEDPVTGSAHTVLAPFWNKFHPTKAGSGTLVGKQSSKRGGIIKCTLEGDRVILSGSTDVVVEGTINI